MKILKMIIILTLCFLLVGCGESKSSQVKEAYFDKGIDYAYYKITELYTDDNNQKERDELIDLCDWLLDAESNRLGFVYDKENGKLVQPNKK